MKNNNKWLRATLRGHPPSTFITSWLELSLCAIEFDVSQFVSQLLSLRDLYLQKACRNDPKESLPLPAKMSKIEYCAQTLQKFLS